MGHEVSGDQGFEVDLWGNRVYVRKGKRGRPPFERTEENANKVSMLLALGWTNDRIAACILDPRTGKSISKPTLKRHFRAELAVRDTARDQLIAKQFTVTMTAAFGGNVGAMRLLHQMVERNDMMLAERFFSKPKATEPTEKLGKKEISAQAAVEAEEALTSEIDAELADRAVH